MFCDASDLTCAAVVFQKKGKNFFLVSCFSKKFPKSIIDRDIYTKELFCLKEVCRSFRYLFIGAHTKYFWVDNRAVVAAQKSRAPSVRCLFENIKTTFYINGTQCAGS